MNGLALFVMRGPGHAAGVAAAGLLLGYILPPFAWLSAAVVALVTLRLGEAALVRMALPALAMVAVAGGLIWSAPGVVILGALAAWAPAFFAARVLRQRARLDDALLIACAIGWLVVAGIHLALPDPEAAWLGLLESVIQPERVAAEMDISAEALQRLIERTAPLMTGMVGASVTFSTVTSVLLARWWQSLLDHPGAFQREFHALRLGRVAAAVAAVVLAAAIATPVSVIDGLALVAVMLYVFQGLAVAHGLVQRRGMAAGWLVGLYVLAIILPLQVMVGLTLVGLVDAWMDFRAQGSADSS